MTCHISIFKSEKPSSERLREQLAPCPVRKQEVTVTRRHSFPHERASCVRYLMFPISWETFFFLLKIRVVPRPELQFPSAAARVSSGETKPESFSAHCSPALAPCATSLPRGQTASPRGLLIFSSTCDTPPIVVRHFHYSYFSVDQK